MIGTQVIHRSRNIQYTVVAEPVYAAQRGVIVLCCRSEASVTPEAREIETFGIMDLAMSTLEIASVRSRFEGSNET